MKKLLVNGKEDPDISEDSISILVTQRENKLWDAVVTADDEMGKTYLGNVHIDDDITIQFMYEDDPGDVWRTVFIGKVVELNPELSTQGEVCGIRAVQHPGLKRMRVAEEYGIESRTYRQDELAIDDDEEVDGWASHINGWTHVNNSPWLHIGDSDKITISADATYLGVQDGDFTFQDFSCARDMMSITELNLNLRCRLVAGAGGAATSAKVRPSIHDGTAWHNLDEIEINSTSWVIYTLDVISILDIANFDDFKLLVTLTDVVGGGATKGNVEISWVYFHVEGSGYNSVGTLREVMTDPDVGIIPNYTEKVLGGIASGYSLGTDYIWDCASEFRYILFPFEPCLNALNDLITLLSAMDKPCHWIILPSGELVIAPLGNHVATGAVGYNIENIWKTYGRVTPITVKKNMITTEFSQKEVEANYVVINGIYEFPINDYWSEGRANQWEANTGYGSVSDDGDCKEGSYSVRLKSLGSGGYKWFRWGEPLNIDFEKIWTKKQAPLVKFWFYAGPNTSEHKVVFFKDWTNRYEYTLTGLVASQWTKIEVSLDDEGWVKVGTLDWSEIQYIGFSFYNASTLERISKLDSLRVEGSVIRAAYSSTSIAAVGARVKLITDSLAKCDSLDAGNDSSTLARFAKAELYRGMSTPLVGTIKIPMDARLVAGQLVYVKMSPRNANFPHDTGETYLTMRILEHKISYCMLGAFSYLTLTSDVTNSIALSLNDMYSAVLRASNPDYQDRDRASLKGKDIDIGETILAKDYA